MSEQQSASMVSRAWDATKATAQSAGKAVVDTAQAAGRTAADAARTAGKAVADTAQSAGKAVVDTAQAAGRTAADAARTAGKAVTDTAKAAGELATDAAQAAKDGIRRTADEVAQGATEAYQGAREAVIDTAQVVKEGAGKIVDGAKTVVDVVAAGTAISVVRLAKASKTVEECLTGQLSNPGGKPGDGQYMGKDCGKTQRELPAEGVKPAGCGNSGRSFPKIIYTNGINTPPQTACDTMHAIADSRCAEVIGIYNATDGMLADVANANLSIEARRNDPAAVTLSQTIQDMSKRGEAVTLYAHSEGGLNSIIGLRDAYDKMEYERDTAYANAAMKSISVTSFGTAETGWPDGPSYQQYTNRSDPVPHVIRRAQASSGNRALNLREAANTARDRFTESYWNPINAHSMDVYLDRLNSGRPVRKGPGGSCCG